MHFRHIFETWVTIKYGSSNHSDPPSTVRSRRIELQNGTITGVMALIELESEIEMSANAKPAKLPKRGVSVLTNTTKLCGWMLHVCFSNSFYFNFGEEQFKLNSFCFRSQKIIMSPSMLSIVSSWKLKIAHLNSKF